MTLFLLSLTGIPPTAGFFAKANVILAAVEAGGPLTILAVITVLNAAVAAFYYLRVVVYMFMRESATDAPALRHGAAAVGRAGGGDAVHDPARALPDRACSTRPATRPRRSSRTCRTSAPLAVSRPRARRRRSGRAGAASGWRRRGRRPPATAGRRRPGAWAGVPLPSDVWSQTWSVVAANGASKAEVAATWRRTLVMTYRKRWSSFVQTSTTIPFILLPFETCDWVEERQEHPGLGVGVQVGRAALRPGRRAADRRYSSATPHGTLGALDDRQVDPEARRSGRG